MLKRKRLCAGRPRTNHSVRISGPALRWSDWVRAYRATAEFFDRSLAGLGERKWARREGKEEAQRRSVSF